MVLKILPKANLQDWIDHLSQRFRIIAPRSEAGVTTFEVLRPGERPDLEYATTLLSPKKAFLPPKETLIKFESNLDRDQLKPVLDDTPTVLMGVHTCDLHAIGLLDRVFASGALDQHYQTRRENTTIVSLECLQPCSEHCFCKSMGTLGVPEQYDLHITDLGDDYALEIGSSAGLNLLWDFFSFRDSKEQDYVKLDKVMSEKWSQFTYRLDADVTELSSLMSLSYENPLWEELGERCLSCGACNLVCPTCYCFDVHDEISLDLKTGVRLRTWDSCQLPRFATVAGGHNFRVQRGDRLRHRFMRKGKYLQESFGVVGCVGCGRCALACPVHITPIEVFNQLMQSRDVQVHTVKEAAA
jgi:sulfhydrogenase subunit beta (sulfur reductase)